MAYDVEGRLLEVCTCNVLCPCWIGGDPDGGTCESTLGWRIENGTIGGESLSAERRRGRIGPLWVDARMRVGSHGP